MWTDLLLVYLHGSGARTSEGQRDATSRDRGAGEEECAAWQWSVCARETDQSSSAEAKVSNGGLFGMTLSADMKEIVLMGVKTTFSSFNSSG